MTWYTGSELLEEHLRRKVAWRGNVRLTVTWCCRRGAFLVCLWKKPFIAGDSSVCCVSCPAFWERGDREEGIVLVSPASACPPCSQSCYPKTFLVLSVLCWHLTAYKLKCKLTPWALLSQPHPFFQPSPHAVWFLASLDFYLWLQQALLWLRALLDAIPLAWTALFSLCLLNSCFSF